MLLTSEQIIKYIEARHLKDGGYFFANIEPSSGADTYYAVKTLKMLGAKLKNPESIVKFFQGFEKDQSLSDITGIFFAVETICELGYQLSWLKKQAHNTVEAAKNEKGGFGQIGELYVESVSELETTYRAIIIARHFDFKLDINAWKRFILSFRNADGGYGSYGLSLLPTTFYAVSSLLDLNLKSQAVWSLEFLKVQEERNISLFFLEDIYWLYESLYNLGSEVKDKEKIADYLEGCQRNIGGFGRSPSLAIATFQDTFYAVSLIKHLEL
jgi:hypothetical protein